MMERKHEVLGEIVDLGTLREVIGGGPEVWKGAISREKRFLSDGDLYGKEDDVATIEAQLPRFYVQAAPGAPKRCVDGRSPDTFVGIRGVRKLGPQIAGGSSGEANADRLARGVDDAETFGADVSNYISRHYDSGESIFSPGNHISDHCSPGCTGCGKVDTQEERNNCYKDQPYATLVAQGASALLKADGKQFDPAQFERMRSNAAALCEVAPDYYKKLKEVVEAIAGKDFQGIETLRGKHNELSVVINFVRGTTFDRDEYNRLSNGHVEAFGLDIWNILDEHEPAVAQAILCDTISTLMALTDGSLRIRLHVPAKTAPSAN